MLKTISECILPWIVAFMAWLVAVLQPLPGPLGPPDVSSAEPGESSLGATQVAGEGISLPLSLRQAILLALRNNQDIRIERLNPLIREEEVKREQGAFFDPLVRFEFNYNQGKQPAGSVLEGAAVPEADTLNWNTSLSITSSTGGVVSLDFKNQRLETNSVFQVFVPQYTSDLFLNVTHPLLKNFGVDVNQTKVKIARNNLEISRRQLNVVVMDILSEVQKAYWDQVLATTDLAARRRSLEFAHYLERRARDMVAAGRLPEMAILEAEIGVKEREIDLLAGENALKDAQDRLKALFNMGRGLEPSDLTIVPIDRPPFVVEEVSVEKGLKTALEKRPELFQARLDLENNRSALKFAKNQTLPELNIVGSVGCSSIAGTQRDDPLGTVLQQLQGPSPFEGGYGDALTNLFECDALNYSVGLTFQVPLGNRQARSDLQKARQEAEQARYYLQTVEQKIALEVQAAAREITAAQKAMEQATSLTELAERKLEMAQGGLELGVSTVTAVLEAEKDLTRARRDELQAVIQYSKSLILWDKVAGMTLDRFDIEL